MERDELGYNLYEPSNKYSNSHYHAYDDLSLSSSEGENDDEKKAKGNHCSFMVVESESDCRLIYRYKSIIYDSSDGFGLPLTVRLLTFTSFFYP